jgi:hypothetical protein
MHPVYIENFLLNVRFCRDKKHTPQSPRLEFWVDVMIMIAEPVVKSEDDAFGGLGQFTSDESVKFVAVYEPIFRLKVIKLSTEIF